MNILGFQLTFTNLLILEALLLFIVFVVLLRSRQETYVLRHIKLTKILVLIVKVLISVILILLIYSLVLGFRPFLFFLICGVLTLNLLLLISNNKHHDNHSIAGITLFIMIILLLVEPLVLTFGNDFYPRWEWWNDSIYVTGSLNKYIESIQYSGLYYLIPVEELWMVLLALVTSPTHIVPAIILIAQSLSIALGAYLFAKFSQSSRLSLAMFSILLFILIASPGDHIITGRTVKTNPFIYLSLVYIASRQGLPRTLIPLIIVMMPMVFYHGSAVIALLSLLLPLLVLHRINRSSIENVNQTYRDTEIKSITLSTILLTLFSFTYWFFTYVARTVLGIARGFIESLVNYFIAFQGGGEIQKWSYTPLYFEPSYYVYSYAWAFPMGVSIALVLNYFIDILTRKRSWTTIKMNEIAAIIGSLYSITSYTAYTIGEKGQYFIPVAFFLLHIATAVTISTILTEKRIITRLICIIAFTAFVIIGMHSPSHAMLEHPEFESAAIIFRATRYIEASLVSRLIPSYVTTYYDYDLPVQGGIYKTIRGILYQILSGVDPANFYVPPYTLIAVKNTRPIANINMEKLDVVYSSSFYTILGVKK